MKLLSRSKAIARLQNAKDELRSIVGSKYEHRAKDCLTCDTRGACCLDAHFVNVRISRLEAEVINTVLNGLAPFERQKARLRIEDSIDKYELSLDLESAEQTYACPLFDEKVGCMVHKTGKPAPCITHACYESSEDLPPGELLEKCELTIDDLNVKVYGRPQPLLPIPLALRAFDLRPDINENA